jgi:hypothetical protein
MAGIAGRTMLIANWFSEARQISSATKPNEAACDTAAPVSPPV